MTLQLALTIIGTVHTVAAFMRFVEWMDKPHTRRKG